MFDLTSTFRTTSAATSANTKHKIKTRGATMYTKVKKTHESGIRYPITIDIRTDKAYEEHADDFMGYIALQGILIDSWHKIDEHYNKHDLASNI